MSLMCYISRESFSCVHGDMEESCVCCCFSEEMKSQGEFGRLRHQRFSAEARKEFMRFGL